jgi:MFS family permease
MLFHQADKTIIVPLISSIMDDFQINEATMGAVSSLAIIVSSLLYPIWGFLYDRFSRPKLISLASFIWGSTTALSAIAPNIRLFMISRASTGIDDSSYPGLYSLLSDYFKPTKRGKIYGIMQTTGPIGLTLGILLSTFLDPIIGWRNIFLITGSLGVIISFVIFFLVKERPRGSSEPELNQLEELTNFRFTWKDAKELWKIKSFLLLIAHGFVALFIWNMLVFWLFHYLKTERGYTAIAAMVTMLVVNSALIIGYFLGGFFGDKLFSKNKKGRMIVSSAGTICGGATLVAAFLLPLSTRSPFLILLFISGLFLSSVSPNLVASVHDVTLPEVRSSAQAFRQVFIDISAAAAPFVAGLIAVNTSLHKAILSASVVSWIAATGLVLLITYYVSDDIEALRNKLKHRAGIHTAKT